MKKISKNLWILMVVFFSLFLLTFLSSGQIKRKGAGAVGELGLLEIEIDSKDHERGYSIEILIPDQIIIVEQIRDPEDIMGRRAGDPDGFRSAVEIFKEAIKEVEKDYNVYSACPILEPGHPPVFGSWTKALILFVKPKE